MLFARVSHQAFGEPILLIFLSLCLIRRGLEVNFFFRQMVMDSPQARISDSDSFFCNILIRVEIENGGRKAKVECCCLGYEVAREA